MSHKQTRKGTLVESTVQLVVGVLVGIGTQALIFPHLFNIHVPVSTNVGITAIMAAVSFVRSYVIRRLFAR